MTTSPTTIKAIQAVLREMEKLDESELNRIIVGAWRFSFDSDIKPSDEAQDKVDEDEDLRIRIEQCKDRETVKKILSSIPNKNILIRYAKNNEIYVAKYDKRTVIENKITEFAIGRKLGRAAIKNLNLQSGGPKTEKTLPPQ
jgi:hypothetical protein